MKAKTFEVSYTKKVGGDSTIIVKAENEETALKNAAYLCHTGSNFRSPREVDNAYIKPVLDGSYTFDPNGHKTIRWS